MKLVFLYGLPGTGKLTVGRALAALTGYRLFHNHLVVDMLLSVFPFGSESFVELRERVWLSVFEHAAASDLPGLIFTFAPERTVRTTFIETVRSTIARRGGQICFVELTCERDALLARLGASDRREHGKLTSAATFAALEAAGAFEFAMPPPDLSIDTGTVSPVDAARRIAALLR